MNKCPSCPLRVPVISQRLAKRVLSRVPEPARTQVKMRALEWLVENHPGLELYQGLTGHYTEDDKDVIALETLAVSNLPCPMWEFGRAECVLGGLGPHYNEVEEQNVPPYLWLPTAVSVEWAHDEFKALVASGYVADAKVALLSRNTMFLSKQVLTRA